MKTPEQIVSEALDKAMRNWDIEEKMGDPRFVFKHALRLQGLFLEKDGSINDSRGDLYATLQSVDWKENSILEAKIKLVTSIDFLPVTIDVSKL